MNLHTSQAPRLMLANQAQVADCPIQLPTQYQVMQGARLMAAASLKLVIESAVNSDEWSDDDHDAICAVEIALDIVQTLEFEKWGAPKNYEEAWWRATSMVRLAMNSFSSKETHVWRLICMAVSELEVLLNFADFLSNKACKEVPQHD